ncbi:MAG: hypothetical protein ACTSRK_15995 [Promethearchaeota archaeon]
MQSPESESESVPKSTHQTILPQNINQLRYKTIVLLLIIVLLAGKIFFLILQSNEIFGNDQEILQLFDLIFALLIGIVIYYFIYLFDYPEILARLLTDQQFLREQEKPILEKCRFLYGGLGATLYYLGWSFGTVIVNITFASGIVGFISGIGVLYFLRQISERMVKDLKLPLIKKVNSPQNLIKQILIMIFIFGILGTLYMELLLLGIYIYFQANGILKTGDFSRFGLYSSDFSSSIEYQPFWKLQFLKSLVINFACLLFLLLPPWYLVTISMEFYSLGVILLLLIPPSIFQLGGYIVVNRRSRMFGLPIRRLLVLSFSWVYLIIVSYFLQSSLANLLIVSRFDQMELILLNDMFLGVYLLLSPMLQIYFFTKSASTQLTFRSRKQYSRMFIFYGLSLFGVEVVLVLLALVGFGLQLFLSFGIGIVGAVLFLNIFLLPAFGKILYEQYRKGIKNYT